MINLLVMALTPALCPAGRAADVIPAEAALDGTWKFPGARPVE